MKIKPGAVYAVKTVTKDGFVRWNAIQGDRASSANVKRTTVEEVGLLLSQFMCDNLKFLDRIEVFELPDTPVAVIQGKDISCT